MRRLPITTFRKSSIKTLRERFSASPTSGPPVHFVTYSWARRRLRRSVLCATCCWLTSVGRCRLLRCRPWIGARDEEDRPSQAKEIASKKDRRCWSHESHGCPCARSRRGSRRSRCQSRENGQGR